MYAEAPDLAQVGLEGAATQRVLLLAMRRRSGLSAATSALVDMLEEEGSAHAPAQGL